MSPGYTSTTSDRFLLYYRGFDLLDHFPGILGRQFYQFRMIGEDGSLFLFDVSRNDPGYTDYQIYYPDGQLSMVAQCYLKFQGGGLQIPMPDDTNILSATCYRTDGSVGSEVINGAGVQT